jgi:hypothetical protein
MKVNVVMRIDLQDSGPAARLIPGAYEQKAPMSRQPGAMGGSAFGSATAAMAHSSMDAAIITDREREGGGAPSKRRPKVPLEPRTGPALRDPDDKRSWLTGGFLWFQILRLARR